MKSREQKRRKEGSPSPPSRKRPTAWPCRSLTEAPPLIFCGFFVCLSSPLYFIYPALPSSLVFISPPRLEGWIHPLPSVLTLFHQISIFLLLVSIGCRPRAVRLRGLAHFPFPYHFSTFSPPRHCHFGAALAWCISRKLPARMFPRSHKLLGTAAPHMAAKIQK
jgi:hypothetical protein